jgi:hypothetical protein
LQRAATIARLFVFEIGVQIQLRLWLGDQLFQRRFDLADQRTRVIGRLSSRQIVHLERKGKVR